MISNCAHPPLPTPLLVKLFALCHQGSSAGPESIPSPSRGGARVLTAATRTTSYLEEEWAVPGSPLLKRWAGFLEKRLGNIL